MLSTCCYSPDLHYASYPLREVLILQGDVEPSNASYALSKRFIAQYSNIINKQFGYVYSYLILTNLYSKHDKFDLDKSHFVTCLVLKIFNEVYYDNKGFIEFKGTGNAIRQFISSEDVAKVIKVYIENDYRVNLNVVSFEMSIKEMCESALKVLKLEDNIELRFDNDPTKDGIHKKTASDYRFKQYYPDFNFKSFEEGVLNLWEELKKRNNIQDNKLFL